MKREPNEIAGYTTKRQVADRLHKTTRTIDAWMAKGHLPYVKIGRAVLFDWKAIEAHFAQNFTVHGRKGSGE